MEMDLVARFEAAVARLEALSVAGGGVTLLASRGLAEEVPEAADPAIVAFDELVERSVGSVAAAAENIGGKVLEATKILQEAFAVLKELLVKSKQRQKPDVAGLQEFLKPLNGVMVKANSLTEGRRTEYFNHSKTVADSLTALAWIAYLGKYCGMSMPIAHVEESWQMAEFYNNKVLVEYRSKNSDHVDWAKAMKELYVPSLRDFVKSFYPLGPVWGTVNSRSVSVASSSTVAKTPPAKAPAPPPPPSAPLFTLETAPSRPKEGMSAVFQEISTNKSVTTGLRKVTDDMKAKNRADRTGVVSTTEKGHSRATSFSFSKEGPPKMELQMGRKWAVENQVGKKNLVIDDCDSKQSVYVYGCKDSVLQVKGKVNNITVDKCIKLGVVFMDVVAAFEIVNSSGVEVQCQGSAPSISIDNTSGCQLYLSKDSLGASLTTAKSSEINVLVPGAAPDGDWVEHALPQQYVHTFKDGQLTTTPVSHSGG